MSEVTVNETNISVTLDNPVPSVVVEVSSEPAIAVVAVGVTSSGGGTSFTVADTDSVDLDLTAEVLSADVLLSGGTLAIDASGVKVADNGIGDTQISSVSLSKLSALTASRALQSGAGGVIEASSVTATELGHVSGVTSAIQTQINAKLGTTLTSANVFVGSASNVATGVAVTGDISVSNAGVAAISSGVIVNADVNASAAIAQSKLAALTASRALVSDGSGVISVSATTATEVGHLSGVTSAIQTQLDSKWSTAGNAGLTTPVLGTTDPVSVSVRTNGIGRIYLDALTEKMNFLGGLGTDPDDLSGKFNFAGVVSISPDNQANENGALYLTNGARAPDPVPVGTRQIALFSDDSGTLGLKSDTGSGFKINLTGQITNPDDTFVTMPSAASSASTVWVLEDTAQTLTNKTISFDSNAITGRVSGGTKSLYVSKSGNDSTGDGTYFYPYLTITRALTAATGATAADPYFIYIYPGAYTETAGFKFKSFCHMMGVVMGGNPVEITCSGGIASDLLGADPILFMENIRLISAVTMKPDSTATGNAIVKPNHCQFVNTLEVASSASCYMNFTLENNSFTEAAMTIKSAYVEFDYSFALSSITCTHVGGAALGELGMYGAFFTSISMNNSGASGGSIHLASSGSYNNGGTISVTGSGATLKSDADSLPVLASNVTLAGGATMSLLTSAYAIKYTPTTSSNWVATAPVSVLEGLDDLAKRWATGTFTGTTITQNTKALDQMHTYNGGSAQVFGATGFGTIANFQNGTRITIIGTHATNTLTLNDTDAANGYLLKSTAILAKGSAITLMYNSTLARMVEVSRSI